MKNKLINYLAIPLVAFGIVGCEHNSHNYTKCKKHKGYIITAWRNECGSNLRIENKNHAYVYALDRSYEGMPGYEKFNEIRLKDIPKGDSLEKFANLDTINKLFKEVRETGCNCDSIKQRK